MVNHIPNCQIITNKLGLLNTLESFTRVSQYAKINGGDHPTRHTQFLPETFRLGEQKQRDAFWAQYKDDDLYICKPTSRNQGKGIFIVTSKTELDTLITQHNLANEQNVTMGKPKCSLNRIIQRYITNPLLINRKKFDIRAYMLIANTVPYLVLYQKGYIRLSIHDYSENYTNLIAHLTNQFVQKKDPSYKHVKEDTTWSIDQLNDYINDHIAKEKKLPKDWVYGPLTQQIKKIMLHCFKAAKHRFSRKVGYFDLYGFDFMIDENMKTWLIEINVNPCLATNCKALAEIIPKVTSDTLKISIECFNKARKGRNLLPLECSHDFSILFSDEPTSSTTSSSSATAPTTAAANKKCNTPTIKGEVKPPPPPTPIVEKSPLETKPRPRKISAGGGVAPPTANGVGSTNGAGNDNNNDYTNLINNNGVANNGANSKGVAIVGNNVVASNGVKNNTVNNLNNSGGGNANNVRNNNNNINNANRNNNTNNSNNYSNNGSNSSSGSNSNANNGNNNGNNNSNNVNNGGVRGVKTAISAAAEASIVRLARPYRQKPPVPVKQEVDIALTHRMMVLPRATVSYDKKPSQVAPPTAAILLDGKQSLAHKSPYIGDAVLLKMTHTILASDTRAPAGKQYHPATGAKEKRFRGA